MSTHRRLQRGAYLVVASVLMVVLLGFGALSLDVGRLFVLRSQMQNGIDSAALAAAGELSRSAGAQARAESAARNVLEYESGISEVAELLGVNITLEFFCAISSEYDPDPSSVVNLCPLNTAYDSENKVAAVGDEDSHYVRVTMDQSVTSDAYSIPLFFLPVLNLFGLNVDTQSFLQASAVAGRNYYYCDYPPMMLCNPFEDNSPPQNFPTAMNPGESMLLATQGGGGSGWAPGIFGFLALLGTTGASAAAPFLADEGVVGCTTPEITTEPGQMTELTEGAIDTRFDLCSNPGFGGSCWNSYPPASNVIDYPRDQTYRAGDPRFGNGDWDRTTYWNTYHAWQPWGAVQPIGYSTMTRFEMYEWEISNNYPPSQDPAMPYPPGTDDTTYDGVPDPTHNPSGQTPERRVMSVAVVNCLARGLSGRRSFPIFGQEGFARVFLTEQAVGPPNREIWAEYIGWQTPGGTDSNAYVDIQLYE